MEVNVLSRQAKINTFLTPGKMLNTPLKLGQMSGLVTGGFEEEPNETLWQIYANMMMKSDNIPFGQC